MKFTISIVSYLMVYLVCLTAAQMDMDINGNDDYYDNSYHRQPEVTQMDYLRKTRQSWPMSRRPLPARLTYPNYSNGRVEYPSNYGVYSNNRFEPPVIGGKYGASIDNSVNYANDKRKSDMRRKTSLDDWAPGFFN